MSSETSPDQAPLLVSVLMPVRNEAAFIELSLESVLAQSHGLANMEILVIDGMSEDDTRPRVERLAAAHPGAHVRILDNPGRIAPTALNVGLRAARGEVLVRVDGHCEIAPDYVENAVRHLHSSDARTSDAHGVGGTLETIGEGVTARTIAAAMSSPFGVGSATFRTSRPGGEPRRVDTIAFPAYQRSVIDLNGYFDEELVRNQDDEFNYRLRKNGGRIYLVGDMPARYYSRSSFAKLWRQYLQYGFWKVRVLQKHPRQMSWRQFVPPAFVATLLLSAIMAGSGVAEIDVAGIGAAWASRGAWLLVATVVAYLLANLGASVWTARRHQVPIWRLPLAFAILHLSYGAGFLGGLIYFIRRWRDPAPAAT